jgi:hypothetical protein
VSQGKALEILEKLGVEHPGPNKDLFEKWCRYWTSFTMAGVRKKEAEDELARATKHYESCMETLLKIRADFAKEHHMIDPLNEDPK